MECYFGKCRYNKYDECTNQDKGKECMEAVNGVLGRNEDGCRYCNGQKDRDVEICEPIKLKKTASETDMKDCQIIKHKGESPALMFFDRFYLLGYFDISYCPMCGRKLV
jgi:hypothetical protein